MNPFNPNCLSTVSAVKIEGFLLSCLVLLCCLWHAPVRAQQLTSTTVESNEQHRSMPVKCIDESLIHDDVACPEIYDPVCGCDGVTYENECVARYRHGVTDYTKGPCDCRLELSITSRMMTCDGANICISMAGGEGPYTAYLNDGTVVEVRDDGSLCLRALEAGQYIINVRSSNGCRGTIGFLIPSVDYYLEGEVKNLSCFGARDGAITLFIEVDVALSFEWSGPDGFASNRQNIEGLAAGHYQVKVSYQDGSCFGIMGFQVQQPRPLQLDIRLNDSDCTGQPDGCALISGGTAPYRLFVFTGDLPNDTQPRVMLSDGEPRIEYLDRNDEVKFEDPLTTDLTRICAENIPDGIYYVLVLDDNDCYAFKRVVIEAVKPLNLEVKTKDVSCHGADDGSICYLVEGGLAPYKTVIVPATPILPLEGEAGCFDGLPAGEYEIIVTDARNCSYSTTVKVHQDPPLEAEFTFTSDICDENVSGCLRVKGGTQPYRIFVFTCPEPISVFPEPVLTDDNRLEVEGMEATDLLPFDVIATNLYERCVDNIPAGIYYIVVLDAKGCWTYEKVEVPAAGGLVIEGKVRHVSCFEGSDGAIEIDIIGGQPPYTVRWYTAEGVAIATPIDIPAGIYIVEVYDQNQCTGKARFAVEQPEELTIDFRVTSPDCGDSVDGCLKVAGGTPGYHIWVFTCPDPTPVLEHIVPVFDATGEVRIDGMVAADEVIFYPNTDEGFVACAQDIPAGVYYVLVVDQHRCWKLKRVKIDPPAGGLEIAGEVKHLSCHGATDGAIDIKVLNGTAPFTYSWSNGAHTEDIEGLPAGEYIVKVEDTQGCVGRQAFVVRQPDALNIEFRITSEACASQVNGCLKVSGGTPGYKIWVFSCPNPDVAPTDVQPVFNPNEVPSIEGMVAADEVIFYPNTNDGFVACAQNIPPGVYYVLVVDHKRCWKVKRIKIDPPTGGLEIAGEVKQVSCHDGADGAIDIKVLNGTAPYTYSWSHGATTGDVDGLAAGEYIVKIEDANGCFGRKAFVVRQPQPLEIAFRITSEACADQVDGCLKISGGTPEYKIWIYQCPDPVIADPQPVFTAGDAIPVIDGMERTDAVQFDYTNEGNLVRCARDIPAGIYYILVVDSKRCWKLEKVEVPSPNGIRITGELKCSNGNDGAIDIEVSGAQPPYYYSWSNGETTQDISGLAPGEYTVKVYTSNDFCTATATFTVGKCCDIVLNCKYDFFGEYACVDPEGGTPDYRVEYFNLTTGQRIPTSDDPHCVFDLAPGSYYVKVTDAKGCTAEEIFIIDEKPCNGGEAIVDPSEIKSGESTVFTLLHHTAVSLQWQFRTHNTDWVDIPDATTEVYVTPPIHVGSDKRIEVRAEVICADGSVLYSSSAVLYVYAGNSGRVVDAGPEETDRKLFDGALNQLPEELEIRVFPTVSTGDITLQFENEYQSETRIHVLDLNGQVRQSLNAGIPLKGDTRAIDMNGYRPGMYMITVESNGQRSTRRVFIGN